jgi:hypothetical protein
VPGWNKKFNGFNLSIKRIIRTKNPGINKILTKCYKSKFRESEVLSEGFLLKSSNFEVEQIGVKQ